MNESAVLFLCTHNAGRSQMAMAFFKQLAGARAAAYPGGSEPADEVNPAAVAAMFEKVIDISAEQPARWTPDVLVVVDVVITMGCGDACPIVPGCRYEEWSVPDPAGLDLKDVRPIRDEIETARAPSRPASGRRFGCAENLRCSHPDAVCGLRALPVAFWATLLGRICTSHVATCPRRITC